MDAAVSEHLGHLAVRASHFRGPLHAIAGRGPFKEWLHFCVFAPHAELVVNLSIMERPRAGDGRGGQGAGRPLDAPAGAVIARLVVLARSSPSGRWLGSVEEIPASGLAFAPGRVDASFGDTAIRARAGGFEMLLRPRGMSLSARLRFEPKTLPLMRPATSLGEGQGVVNWLAIPRLRAYGSIVVDGETDLLRGCPAYHDHNWGQWRWGRDFFWQWAFGLPSDAGDPWTVVFYRLFDRRQTVEHALAVLVWRHQQLFRVFHAGDVTVGREDFLRAERIGKFPAVMGLLHPGLTSDVPRRLLVWARAGSDELAFEVDNRDLAQVLVPSEVDLDTTVINEVVGSYRARGRIQGLDVRSEGHSFHEHVTQA